MYIDGKHYDVVKFFFSAYEEDFVKQVLPEYSGYAESMFEEMLETCDEVGPSLVILGDEKTKTGNTVLFLFDITTSDEDSKSDIAWVKYQGCYE